MSKKQPFTEKDLAGMGMVEVEPGVFKKGGEKPKEPKINKIEVPGSSYRGKRKSKYGVSDLSERTYNGQTYMSKLEMLYRKHLDVLMSAKQVLSIKEQVPFPIVINNKKICTYILDFEVKYTDRTEYVDVKGMKTSIYRLKKKLVEACYPITITEIKKGDF